MARALKIRFGFSAVIALSAVIAVLPVFLVSPALSQTASKVQPADGRKGVIAGIKSYEAGRMDNAISTLTKAIGGGGLSSQDLAKALYYRGLASSRSGKSAQAIADLTSAVWMKGGLSPSEQKTALETRAKAYAAVGVKDPGPPTTSVGAPLPKTAASLPTKAAAKVASSTPATPGSFKTNVNKPAAPAPVGSASGAQASSGNPLSGVGNFFSGLFGGSSSSKPASTASINPKAPASGANTAVSTWSSQTSVAEPRQRVAAVAPAAPVAAASKTTAKPSGKYRLQVAAVRSRDEAERLAGALRQKHSSQIGSRVPDISERVFGNMGTFYQVNVGPFAKASDTQRVCKVLKADGFDCLVVKK